MAWTDVANNQTISNENLKNAIDTGVFSAGGTSIPLTAPDNKKQGTKGRIATYVNIPNTAYPPYANKPDNQLLVKGDIYIPGDFILDAAYGKQFDSMSGSGLPSFTYPVTGGNTTKTYNSKVASQTISLTISGTAFVTPVYVVLYVNSQIISTANLSNTGSNNVSLSLPGDVYAPSTIRIAINSGTAPTPGSSVSFSSTPVNSVAIGKTSGQYQFATEGLSAVSTSIYYPYPYTNGYIYRSTDYGVTWNRITTFYNLWKKIVCSDDGQYVMAIPHYGYPARSTDYGATWSSITANGQKYWSGIAMSTSGAYVTLTGFDTLSSTNGTGTSIYRSTNYGDNSSWSTPTFNATSFAFSSVAMSTSGQYQVASKLYARMYYSSDYGANWSDSVINSTAYFLDLRRNDSGTNNNMIAAYMFASGNGYASGILQSTNNGSSWSSGDSTSQGIIYSMETNSSGTQYGAMYDTSNARYIKTRTNGNFSDLTAAGQLNRWQCIAFGNGYMLAGHSTGLKRSSDSGSTWGSK